MSILDMMAAQVRVEDASAVYDRALEAANLPLDGLGDLDRLIATAVWIQEHPDTPLARAAWAHGAACAVWEQAFGRALCGISDDREPQ